MEATKKRRKKKKLIKLYNVRCSGGKADRCDVVYIYIYHVHVVVAVNGRTDIHRTKEQAYVVYSLCTSYVLFIPIPIPINGPARGKQAS